MKTKKLYRAKKDKMIAGVAGGIARYFGVDSTFARVLFVIGGLFSHGGVVLLYFILAFLMPKEDGVEHYISSENEDASESYEDDDEDDDSSKKREAHHKMSGGTAFGIFIMIIGIFILLSQFISFAFIPFRLIFALVFLLLGAYLLFKRM